jgi:hypothetical protein
LDIDQATRFATCAHCGSKLEIKRSGSAYFTSVLDRLDQTTRDMAGNLEVIKLQNELERLDREWEMQRQSFAIRDKDGNTTYPSTTGSIIGGVIGVGIGILWTIMAIAITSGAPDFGPFAIARIVFPLFGLLFVAAGIASLIKGGSSARRYADAESQYRAQRADLERKADQLGSR